MGAKFSLMNLLIFCASLLLTYISSLNTFFLAPRDTLILIVEDSSSCEKTKDNEYIIKAKLQEKDEAIQSMKDKYDTDIELLKNAISEMQHLLKNPAMLAEISSL
jgi:hypothetical protein